MWKVFIEGGLYQGLILVNGVWKLSNGDFAQFHRHFVFDKQSCALFVK